MSSPVERAALVGLLRQGRRPWQVYAELVEGTGSALRVLEHELERDAVPQSLFDAEVRGPDISPWVDLTSVLDDAGADLAIWQREGIEVVTVLDLGYPENLRGVHDRPPLLFVRGELTAPDARAIAVVGSRAASNMGLANADRLARDFVQAGYTVVSGLAAGIDTAVHEAALDCGGRTLAVLGTGLRRCYPAENEGLARRIVRECALLSQFWPDAPPTRRSFPMRNGVMSGLTLGSVIVEASQTSGTRVQARLALAQGRPVFLHSSLLSQAWARELATRPGTHVIGGAEEVIACLERLGADEELVADATTVGSPGG
jgi:DNA processing protein